MLFPNLVYSARRKAITPDNVKSGFRATGIWPLDPHKVLRDVFLPTPLPDPPSRSPSPLSFHIPSSPSRPSYSTQLDDIIYSPRTPTTPRSAKYLTEKGLQLIPSGSPRSRQAQKVMVKLYHGIQRNHTGTEMAKKGEKHLQERITQEEEKEKPDKRQIKLACILETGNELTKKRRERDGEEWKARIGQATRKRSKKETPIKTTGGIERARELLQSQSQSTGWERVYPPKLHFSQLALEKQPELENIRDIEPKFEV